MTLSTHLACLNGIAADIQALNLTGITGGNPLPASQVIVRKLPTDRNLTLPCVLVTLVPMPEVEEPGTNAADDYGYPCLVSIVTANDQDLTVKDAELNWRQLIRNRFNHKKPPGIVQALAALSPAVPLKQVKWEPAPVLDLPLFRENNLFVSAAVVRVVTREVRPPIANLLGSDGDFEDANNVQANWVQFGTLSIADKSSSLFAYGAKSQRLGAAFPVSGGIKYPIGTSSGSAWSARLKIQTGSGGPAASAVQVSFADSTGAFAVTNAFPQTTGVWQDVFWTGTDNNDASTVYLVVTNTGSTLTFEVDGVLALPGAYTAQSLPAFFNGTYS